MRRLDNITMDIMSKHKIVLDNVVNVFTNVLYKDVRVQRQLSRGRCYSLIVDGEDGEFPIIETVSLKRSHSYLYRSEAFDKFISEYPLLKIIYA